MARISQAYLDNQVDYLARLLKIRSGNVQFTGTGAKYHYKDSCVHIQGANGRYAVEINNREGHVWNSPWLTKPELDLYLRGMQDMARVQELKKNRKY